MSFKTTRRSCHGCIILISLAFSFIGNSATNPTELPDTESDGWAAPFILNGTTAALGEFPHQVSLYSTVNDESFCGGSILSPRLVLTAAHCLEQLLPSDLKVIAGLTDLALVGKGTEQTRNASYVYLHEEYDDESKLNDIAVIELDSPLEYNDHVRNINLPIENETFQGNVTVVGWGLTENYTYANKLKKAELTIVEDVTCRRKYRNSSLLVTDNNLCAGVWERGVCNGDSGGPAICKTGPGLSQAPVLCGVVSFGGRCGRTPGVFTRVASFVQWIEQAADNIKAHKTADNLSVNGLNAFNDKLESPLHQAATLPNKGMAVKVIKLLIEMGAAISAEDSEGYTFLHRLLDDTANKLTISQFRDIVDYLLSENLFNLFNIKEPTQGRTPLMLAAANLDLERDTLSLLHSNGVYFNLLDKSGKSVVFHAEGEGDNQKLLADILKLGTPNLDEAITGMDQQSVKLLVRLGADVNGRNGNFEVPLHHAAATNNKTFAIKCIKFLIDNGADASVRDGEGQTFLHKLLSDGTTLTPSDLMDLAQYLFSKRLSSLFNIKDGKRGSTPLMLAARNMELDQAALKFLQRIGVNFSMVDNDQRSYLSYPTEENKTKKLFTEIKSSKTIKLPNFAKAIQATDERFVKVLVWFGANLNETNDELKTPLHLAARAVYKNVTFAVNIIKFLIDSGANAYAIDGHELTFLHRCLYPSRINPTEFHDMAAFLISKDLSQLFNAYGGWEKVTPLQRAVHNVEIERATLDLLKNNGVDFNAVNYIGCSVLCYATWGNRTLRLISDLVDAGASPNHLTHNKESMLHPAAKNGNVELLKFFLDNGLDVNAQNEDGYTPLHDVFISKHGANAFETVQFLLRNGAKADIVNNAGKTPLDVFNYKRDGYPEADKISTCFTLGSSC